MKILVTGGAGFIGSHLVERLLSAGHEVVVFDNFSSGKIVNKKAKNIPGDIRDDEIKDAVSGCEVVFHLAGVAESRATDENLVYTTNYLGAKKVFEAAQENGAKVIFTSSAAVYGEIKEPKEIDECKPISQYGKSKLRAERVCPEGSFVARLFNVYGSRGHSVINKFSRIIPNNKTITVFGHGTQTRDYIHVSDVVAALLLGMELEGTYNVGTGKEKSVLEVADTIHAISGVGTNVRFAPLAEGDVQRSKANIDKIRSLKWEPQVPFYEGIELLLK